MKKIITILLMLFFLVGLTGCAQKQEENQSQESFQERLTETTYGIDALGYHADVKFDPNGSGQVTFEGNTYNFNYVLTDPEGDTATITIEDSGISEVDGKSAKVEFVDNGLRAEYNGFSYVLTPTQ